MDKDIRTLEMRCEESKKMFKALGDTSFTFTDVKRIENLIDALNKYRNMYRKEYRHHMEHKEYLRKAEARANYYRRKVEALTEK